MNVVSLAQGQNLVKRVCPDKRRSFSSSSPALSSRTFLFTSISFLHTTSLLGADSTYYGDAFRDSLTYENSRHRDPLEYTYLNASAENFMYRDHDGNR